MVVRPLLPNAGNSGMVGVSVLMIHIGHLKRRAITLAPPHPLA
jgi:hypothetical protein